MNHSLNTLAFASLKELEGSLKLQIASHNTIWEALIMTGCLMFVIGMAGLCAVYYSKKKTRRRYHHRHSREQLAVEVNAVGRSAEREEKQIRKRRRRSTRPMNPTLAQTGGLPPLRDSETTSYLP